MAWNDHKDEYSILGDTVQNGALDTLSKEQLKKYHTMLANNGAGAWSEAFYWRLCDEIKNLIYQKEKEASDTKRHHEIQIKLEELKKPHSWSFRLLVLSVIFAFLAAIAAVLAVPQVQQVFFESPKSQEKKEHSQPPEQQSHPSKQELRKK